MSDKDIKETILTFGDKARRSEIVQRGLGRLDGWLNQLTGLGTDRDKATYSSFVSGAMLGDEQLDNLYHDEDAAALICDKVPEDALREGFGVKIRDPKTDPQESAVIESDLVDFLEDMNVNSQLIDAWVWSNVMGFGAVILGVEDGKGLSQPIDWENIESFTHMNLVEKPKIETLDWYDDLNQPNFDTPETYLISQSPSGRSGGGDERYEVHESRLVLFGGERTSQRKRKQNKGFDYSQLQRTHAVLKQFGVSWDCLAHVIQDAFQGVFKMEGLMEALAENEHGLIQSRLELLDMSRSAVRALIVDAEGEDFTRQNFSFIGLDSVYDLFMMRLSMASRIPVTILMGRSPAGENSTGDADFQAWYDHVAAERRWKCDKNLEKIIRLAFLAKNGPTGGVEPEHWSLEYPPLWQPSAKEKAEIFHIYSQAFDKLVTSRILLPEEIARASFTANGFTPEITIDDEARKVMLENETKMFEAELEGMKSGGLNGGDDGEDNQSDTSGDAGKKTEE